MIGDIWPVRFLREDEGATAVEYALVAVLIAAAVVVAVGALGVSVNALFANQAIRNTL